MSDNTLALAGVIAGVSLFASMVPGANSTGVAAVGDSEGIDGQAMAVSAIAVSDFDDVAVSERSRAVVAALSARSADPARFSEPPDAEGTAPGLSVGGVQVRPTVSANSGAAWSGRAMGLDILAGPDAGAETPRWWLVGGAGRESYAVAAGGLGEYTIAPVAAQTTIGDAHLGLGFKIGDRAYASLGYVRENRKFTLGQQDWEERDHFIGVGVQARW